MSKYKRILLKISGESLAGPTKNSIYDTKILGEFVAVIQEIKKRQIEVAIVVGGGNIWRGKVAEDINMDRVNADYMGMLATIINAMAIKDVLNHHGIPSIVQSALSVEKVVGEPSEEKTLQALKEGKVVVFGGGTGQPYFTTDTCAALRAVEVEADVVLMAKNGVDGVYSKDPKIDKQAQLYKQISYKDYLNQKLQVIDQSAVFACQEAEIEIVVFNMNDMYNIVRVIDGEAIGTHISKGD